MDGSAMRRADRLFEILQILRRKKVARAADIARALEVSRWTIYRDIRDLMASGVPIDGEAGTGYILRPGFDLPPLMFDEREIAALLLGTRMVESWGDAELASAASDVIAKVRAVVTEPQRRGLDDITLRAPANHFSESIEIDRVALRRSIRTRFKIQFDYRDADNRMTERCVRPLLLAFYGPVWLLPAWCELRQDFRVFRLDRMSNLTVLREQFRAERGKTALDFLKQDAEQNGARLNQSQNGERG
jgi:predicted DNA-binding transcriptional regulator YafY